VRPQLRRLRQSKRPSQRLRLKLGPVPSLNLPPNAGKALALSGQIMGAVALGTFVGSLFDRGDAHLGAGIGALVGVLLALAAVVRSARSSTK